MQFQYFLGKISLFPLLINHLLVDEQYRITQEQYRQALEKCVELQRKFNISQITEIMFSAYLAKCQVSFAIISFEATGPSQIQL
jgi:hypothetical protein